MAKKFAVNDTVLVTDDFGSFVGTVVSVDPRADVEGYSVKTNVAVISAPGDRLHLVMTTREAEDEFGLATGTAKKAAQRGDVPARKSGGTWLIRRVDAEARWDKK